MQLVITANALMKAPFLNPQISLCLQPPFAPTQAWPERDQLPPRTPHFQTNAQR